MKRYIKSNTEVDMKFPRLDKAIEYYNNDFSYTEGCEFQYRVEDDGEPDSVLVFLYDLNEYIITNEYYQYEWVERMIKRFATAVQRDTGDNDFYFDCYDNVEFCGRAFI